MSTCLLASSKHGTRNLIFAGYVAMCEPAKGTHDLVTKGFHVHIFVNQVMVELNLFTDKNANICFRRVHSSTSDELVDYAIEIAFEKCLADAKVREKWIKRLNGSLPLLNDYPGVFKSKAHGRMAEFTFIRVAIERWGGKHGDS
jgi:hypothetical protein